jgi:DNA replication protein DnaC
MSWVGYILVVRTLIPPEIQYILRQCWALLLRPYTSFFCIFHIYKKDRGAGKKNDLFKFAELYLHASGLCKVADQAVLATKSEKEKEILYKLTGRERIQDKFKGVTVWWSLSNTDDDAAKKKPNRRRKKEMFDGDSRGTKKRKEFVLKMHKRDKQFVMTEYLDHVMKTAKEFKREQKELNLISNGHSGWKRGVTFKHPSTFDTLAMDPNLKAAVKADLDKFRQSEEYFRRVGRAWKRGYLLHGPPGTGKSSMIAAMANYLKYDVYDLELTQVRSNNSLKKLFRRTTSKSIIVIEDIDCSINLAGSRSEPGDEGGGKIKRRAIGDEDVTLSALLNSTDGLWSCGHNERIIVFTTNHVEKLDPALIRPGRMDMHIHMSYCSFDSFKDLARSYLSIDSHPAYDTIRFLMEQDGALITPAQVTEHMFGKQEDIDDSMCSIIAQLRKSQNSE